MKKAKVFFIGAERSEGIGVLREKLLRLYDAVGFDESVEKKDLVGIKLHFGEKNNRGYIPPELVKPIVHRIKKKKAKAFLTDSVTLYTGQRSNAVDYLELCREHGFTRERVGAPVVIADGLTGRSQIEVEIGKTHYRKVPISGGIVSADALFILTHFTGHIDMGFAGSIKNMGMGFASRKGKLQQHSDIKPYVDERICTGCRECLTWCPADAISMDEEHAGIDHEKCIGCAECFTICRFKAIKHSWGAPSTLIQEKCAEFALGGIVGKREKVACLNSLLCVTQNCDCLPRAQEPIIEDVGFLVSRDPVAADKASLDLIERKTGKNFVREAWPEVDYMVQITHGNAIGLGTDKYELIEMD